MDDLDLLLERMGWPSEEHARYEEEQAPVLDFPILFAVIFLFDKVQDHGGEGVHYSVKRKDDANVHDINRVLSKLESEDGLFISQAHQRQSNTHRHSPDIEMFQNLPEAKLIERGVFFNLCDAAKTLHEGLCIHF